MYVRMIRDILARRGRLGRLGDAAAIERLMRADPCDGGASTRTLDGLSAREFESDVLLFADALSSEGRSEILALAGIY